MNGAPMTAGGVSQAAQIQAPVAVGMETRSAIIAALDYVEWDPRQI